jgi:hypothetical protein
MAINIRHYRLRYRPVREGSPVVVIEIAASSALEAIGTIRRAEGWIYVLSLQEIGEPKTAIQTPLPITA